MPLPEVPIIDSRSYPTGTEAARRRITRRIDAARLDIGFLVISGRGVAPEVIEQVAQVSREFFDYAGEMLEQAGNRPLVKGTALPSYVAAPPFDLHRLRSALKQIKGLDGVGRGASGKVARCYAQQVSAPT